MSDEQPIMLSNASHHTFSTEHRAALRLAIMDFSFWFMIQYYKQCEVRRDSIAYSNALADMETRWFLTHERFQRIINDYQTPQWLRDYRSAIDFSPITDTTLRDNALEFHRKEIIRLFSKIHNS